MFDDLINKAKDVISELSDTGDSNTSKYKIKLSSVTIGTDNSDSPDLNSTKLTYKGSFKFDTSGSSVLSPTDEPIENLQIELYGYNKSASLPMLVPIGSQLWPCVDTPAVRNFSFAFEEAKYNKYYFLIRGKHKNEWANFEIVQDTPPNTVFFGISGNIVSKP